jgi:hypothetical protein
VPATLDRMSTKPADLLDIPWLCLETPRRYADKSATVKRQHAKKMVHEIRGGRSFADGRVSQSPR